MRQWLLPEEGNFYRANLHTHTNISDGKFTPEEIKARYREKGYSVVAYTDHDIFVPHNDLCDSTFLALNSHEVEVSQTVPTYSKFRKTYHLNCYAKSQDTLYSPVFSERRVWSTNARPYITDEMRKTNVPAEYNVDSINHLIRVANENGFFVSYNHPRWSLQNYADYGGLEGVWGIEVHNTSCVVSNLPDNERPLDDFLRDGKQVFPLCTDDTHHEFDCFGGWTEIKANSLTYDEIVGALLRGDFYASTGPAINELYIEDGTLHVECSDAASILLVTDWRYAKRVLPSEGERTLCHAEIPLEPARKKYRELGERASGSYFRLEVIAQDGSCAYSRAYRMSEIMD